MESHPNPPPPNVDPRFALEQHCEWLGDGEGLLPAPRIGELLGDYVLRLPPTVAGAALLRQYWDERYPVWMPEYRGQECAEMSADAAGVPVIHADLADWNLLSEHHDGLEARWRDTLYE